MATKTLAEMYERLAKSTQEIDEQIDELCIEAFVVNARIALLRAIKAGEHHTTVAAPAAGLDVEMVVEAIREHNINTLVNDSGSIRVFIPGY